MRGVEVIFTGQVQGVGFRITTQDLANHMHITGIVQNRCDGSVLAVLQGDIQQIFSLCKELSSRFTIDTIHIQFLSHMKKHSQFSIIT